MVRSVRTKDRRAFLCLLGLGALFPRTAPTRAAGWPMQELLLRYGSLATGMTVSTFEDTVSPPTATRRWDARAMGTRELEAQARKAVGHAESYEVELVFDPPIPDPKRPGRRLGSIAERVFRSADLC